MRERAYAKINLCLNVKGKREDGYHELEMIMVPIDFYDILEMVPADETSISLNKYYLPVDEKNTIIKAIHIMQERFGITQNFACVLQKHIPTRAGLAGGSADAAAAVRMICRMMHLHVSRDDLISIGDEIGSDVPFCMFNQPSVVKGRGDILEPFVCHPDFELLLVKPRRGVSTKEAFALVDKEETVHPECQKMKDALMQNNYEEIVHSLGNSIEKAAVELVSDIRIVHEKLVEAGFDGVLMSGSGSTVFGITRDRRLLQETMEEMRSQKYFVRQTRVLAGGIYR